MARNNGAKTNEHGLRARVSQMEGWWARGRQSRGRIRTYLPAKNATTLEKCGKKMAEG